MWEAEKVKIRLFGLFRPKSRLSKQNEDQFRGIFSKRSAIIPRSDKADLLGSSAVQCSTVQSRTEEEKNYAILLNSEKS